MASVLEHIGLRIARARGYSSRYIPTGVGEVHVLERRGGGRLPQTVLIHGFTAAGVHYLPMLRHLEPHVRRVIVPDMPAHGFSEFPQEIVPEAMHQGLISAIDASANEPAIIFGNSLGGYAAIHYALARPERVRALVLCSPAGAAMSDGHLADLISRFRVNSHREALDFIDRLFADRSRLRHFYAWSLKRRLSREQVKILLATMSMSRDLLLKPEQLSQLTMPVLLVWGREEKILRPEELAFFRAHLPPHARVAEPRGFGHSPFLERPFEVTRVLLDFVREIH
jgi:pimeloyl-ACP methyl ester carboxylesterase